MAGDWIKMRADLFTHPKVVRMSSALKADTLRTVGGLMSVWCLFDAHSEDGLLEGYSPDVLDSHVRWEGFSAAMMAVGWLEHDPENGLSLPRFDTHNGQSAKRRAQDADRKRDVRKASASDADKLRTREEKRREEIPTTDVVGNAPRKRAAPTPAIACPDDVDPKTWADWLTLRKAKKAPVTDTVVASARREADTAGMALDAFLQVWCMRGSQGLQADWLNPAERQVASRTSFAQADEQRAADRWAEAIGRRPTGGAIDITPTTPTLELQP